MIFHFQHVYATDNPLILTSTGDCLKACFLIHERCEEVPYEEVSDEDLWKQFIHIRLKTTLPLFCEVSSNGVKEAIQSKRKKVLNMYIFNLKYILKKLTLNFYKQIATGQVSFHFPGTNVYLVGGEIEADVDGMTGNPTVEDLMNTVYGDQSLKKKKRNCPEIVIII